MPVFLNPGCIASKGCIASTTTMKKEHYTAVRMTAPQRRDLERVSGRILHSLSETSRLLLTYAIDKVKDDPYMLLDYASKNKQQE